MQKTLSQILEEKGIYIEENVHSVLENGKLNLIGVKPEDFLTVKHYCSSNPRQNYGKSYTDYKIYRYGKLILDYASADDVDSYIKRIISDCNTEEKKDITNKMVIPMFDGYSLVCERNTDPHFDKEFFIYVEKDGVFVQDLASVSLDYKIDDSLQTKYNPDKFLMRLYLDEYSEDFTREYKVPLCKED